MTEWVILSRPECSLCVVMQQQLVALLGPQAAQIRVVDISDDAILEQKYGQRIPVLLIDGECVCTYRLDVGRVQRFLE